jgi:hypothetical protein
MVAFALKKQKQEIAREASHSNLLNLRRDVIYHKMKAHALRATMV